MSNFNRAKKKGKVFYLNKEQLRLKYKEEEVLVVDKKDYDFIPDGLSKLDHNILNFILDAGKFVKRYNAEYNPEYLQIIPYVLIQHKDTYFAVKRTGGDERLIGMISLGMGGHINPEDAIEGKNILESNIIRELSDEELNIDLDKTVSCEPLGFIRYTNPEDVISQDHMGVFYLLVTEDENVTIKETDKMVGGFLTKEEIIEQGSKSESWSKILIEEFIKK